MSKISTPLAVRVSRGVLTIEIGIATLACASMYSEYSGRCADEKSGQPGRFTADDLFVVADARGFAEDVRAALLKEEEDGSSLLTNAIDAACEKAIEDGTPHWLAKDEVDDE